MHYNKMQYYVRFVRSVGVCDWCADLERCTNGCMVLLIRSVSHPFIPLPVSLSLYYAIILSVEFHTQSSASQPRLS
jgi:hypothetical protein